MFQSGFWRIMELNKVENEVLIFLNVKFVTKHAMYFVVCFILKLNTGECIYPLSFINTMSKIRNHTSMSDAEILKRLTIVNGN
jgi:hypothetical protein